MSDTKIKPGTPATYTIQVNTSFRFPHIFGANVVKVRATHTESVTFDNGFSTSWRHLCDLVIAGEAIKL